VEVEEKWRRGGGGATEIQISALEFYGACAYGVLHIFFLEFLIFAGKILILS
jgi:hypothetical protein